MIEGFVGLIGGGKTYSAMMRLGEAVAQGCRVATNISVNLEGFSKYVEFQHGWKLDPEQVQILHEGQIMRFWNHVPKGTRDCPLLVVIDEAPEYVDSVGMKNGDDQKAFHSFCRQSRKFDQNIIFISQDMSFLQKRIRALVAFLWTFRDMRQLRIPGVGIRWPLNQIRQMQWSQDGRTLIRTFYHWKDARIFASYNTFELFNKALGPPADGRVDFRKSKDGEIVHRFNPFLEWAAIISALGMVFT